MKFPQLELTKEAKINYQQAIEICKADYNWNQRKQPNDPKIEDIIESIEREKASAIALKWCVT